jgi:hypothetical protein
MLDEYVADDNSVFDPVSIFAAGSMTGTLSAVTVDSERGMVSSALSFGSG